MHPVFLAPGTPTVPVLFVTSDSWDEVRGRLDPAARAFADAAGFEPRAGRNLLLPAADGTLSAVLFGLDAPDAAARDPFLPGRLPGLLPKGAYRFAEGPPDARPRAIARPMTGRSASKFRRASTARSSRASSRASRSRAISSTRPRTIWVRPTSRARRARSRRVTAPACARSSATICWKRISRSSMRSAAPPTARRGSSTCAGARRPRPRSRSSARACASTPAASTSSPTAPCCS